MKTIAFASAAHEFRNPLNAITQSLALLENKIHDERGKIYFNTAKSCSDLMLNLVKDILDHSQLELNTFLLNYSNVDVCSLINSCLDMFKFKA